MGKQKEELMNFCEILIPDNMGVKILGRGA